MNGGPGCSSLGGLFEELGPFVPNADGKTLSPNPYSWNTIANVIFLESPSGVGFSYSTNTSDYVVGDVRTANDSYNFLLLFFQMYPQFANNPFWVTGESYGGHYVPNLAARVVLGNSQNKQQINFKGFMVGNAWTYAPYDNYGAVFDWWTHALISDATFLGLNSTCDFFNIGPLSADPVACAQFQQTAANEMGNIDIYDIYADVCLTSAHSGRQLLKHLAQAPEHKLSVFAQSQINNVGYEPCVDTYLTNYLNQASVKKAIHALPTIQWVGCSAVVNYSYTDLLASMLPVYTSLIASDVNMLVYSGDVDAIVPITGTRFWLDALNLPITEAWRPWIGSTGQVGGYTVAYKGLTFLSIRNAGHLVPGTQPQRALDFFSKFLTGTPF